MEVLKTFPKNLYDLEKVPKKLYCLGKEDLLTKPMVGIVGSRRPNAYTKRIVSHLASSLSTRGVCVVSGAAMGVDGIAHRASFPNTIAVMGNSLDIIYPKINEDLIKKMQISSLVLSEYEPSFKATRWSFVQRNRIVVALSQAVVIAQADIKSGSMHSARMALELNKPLYVLPQRIGDSDGTNKLLKENKATLIDDIDEFCDIFGTKMDANDEVLEFCKENPSLDKCLDRFGDLIYEYELEGKLQIENLHVRIL